MFYVMAQLLGYDAHQMNGIVNNDKTRPHSWVEIHKKGKVFICDPQFQASHHRNGYMIKYKKKGTYRYTHYKDMNQK